MSDTSVSDTFSKLAVSGTLAIVVFATIGQLSHRGGVSLGGYAADLVPLLASWLVFAALTQRFVPTWLGGVTVGVLIRMVVLGHYRWSEVSFWVVALVFVGGVAFVAWWALRRRMSQRSKPLAAPTEAHEQESDLVTRVQAGIALNKMPPR